MKKNTNIILFYFVTFLFWFSLYTYVPFLSQHAKSLGDNLKMVGIIIGSYGFTQTLLRIPLGIYSDKINKRKPFIIIGLVLSALSGFGLWAAENQTFLMIARGLAGCAAATWVSFSIMFTSYFKKEEAPKAIGIINSANSIGIMSANILGSVIAQNSAIKMTFFAGALAALIALTLAPFTKETKVERKPLKIGDVVKIGSNKAVLIASGMALLVQLLKFSTIIGFVPIIAENLMATKFEIGILLAINSLAIFFASLLSGTFFHNKLGDKISIAIGFALMGFSAFTAPLCTTLPQLFVTQLIGSFGSGICFALSMSMAVTHISPDRRSTAMGFFQALYGIGMFVGPVLTGFLSDYFDIGVAFVVLTGFSIVGIIIALLLADKKQTVVDA